MGSIHSYRFSGTLSGTSRHPAAFVCFQTIWLRPRFGVTFIPHILKAQFLCTYDSLAVHFVSLIRLAMFFDDKNVLLLLNDLSVTLELFLYGHALWIA